MFVPSEQAQRVHVLLYHIIYTYIYIDTYVHVYWPDVLSPCVLWGPQHLMCWTWTLWEGGKGAWSREHATKQTQSQTPLTLTTK